MKLSGLWDLWVKEMMADEDEESVVTVVTCVQPAEFRQVEDEVGQGDVMEEVDEVLDEVDEVVEEEDVNESGDYQYGGNHPMRMGSLLAKRCNEN